MEKIKMGLVGLGTIGQYHARIMSESSIIELAAVCDMNEELAQEAAEMYGCKAYTSVDELCRDEEIQAVSVCVPEDYHVEPVVKLAKAAKHVLTEKPIAKTVKEGRIMIDACKDSGVRFMVGQTTRFLTTAKISKERIDQGEIGDLIQFSVTHQAPFGLAEFLTDRVSIMFYMGVHDIYLAQWLFSSNITKVFALKAQKRNPYAEDSILINFEFANGAIGQASIGMAFPDSYPADYFNFIINGTEGTIVSDTHISGLKKFAENYENIDIMEMYEIDGKLHGALTDTINHFAEALLTGVEFKVETDMALQSVRVIEAIFESLQSGNVVELS